MSSPTKKLICQTVMDYKHLKHSESLNFELLNHTNHAKKLSSADSLYVHT